MQFKLENFKPVQSAEIKVNDLTLIFGDNNTSKTYMAYALYGLLLKWDNIKIKIDGDSRPDFKDMNHFMLREIFEIPNTFISVAERLGISLFQKDLDENMANLMERLKKNKDLDPFNVLIERHQKSNLEFEVR